MTCYDDMICMTGKACYELQEKLTKVRKRQVRIYDMVAYIGLLTGLYVELGCQYVSYVGPKDPLCAVYFMFMHLGLIHILNMA